MGAIAIIWFGGWLVIQQQLTIGQLLGVLTPFTVMLPGLWAPSFDLLMNSLGPKPPCSV